MYTHSWYTQIRISRGELSNKRPKISPVDGHISILGRFHQQEFAPSQTTRVTKMVITRVPEGLPGSIFNQNDPTMSLDVSACRKGVKIN